MTKDSSFGKSLKGAGSLSAKFAGPLEDVIAANIVGGATEFTSVQISGGTIDGVVIGDSQPGPGIFTSLVSGSPEGQGYSVCFFGLTVNESACWIPDIGLWNIKGDLKVRNISDFGNLRINGNTVSSTNLNGNIILSPNGSGNTIINSGITQSTVLEDITFNTDFGELTLNSGTDTTLTSQNEILLNTRDGELTLNSGSNSIPYYIDSVNGNIVTTTLDHPYSIGDKIKITGIDLEFDNYYEITGITSFDEFTINSDNILSFTGNNNSIVEKRSDINLTAKDTVNIPADIKLTFGETPSIYGDTSGNLVLNGTSVMIPDNVPLRLSDTNPNLNLVSDGTDIILTTEGTFKIIGDLLVEGETTYINSTVVSIEDPVINTGGNEILIVNDNKDRGVSSNYYDDGNKTSFFGRNNNSGCFTYIPDSINTNEVFSGDPGCAIFDGVKVNNVSSITPELLIDSSTLSLTSNIIKLDEEPSFADKGIQFNYSESLETKTGFFGYDTSNNKFVILSNTTNVGDVVTGTPADLQLRNISVAGDITIDGKINGSLNSIERINVVNSSNVSFNSPSSSDEITFVSVNVSNSISIAELITPTRNNFIKFINLSFLAENSEYHIVCPEGILLDPGSGTTAAKTLKFDCPGQGIQLIWDSEYSFYMIVNAGCEII